MKISVLLLLLLFLYAFDSYGDKAYRKEKKERKKYEKLKSSFKYLGYSALSKNIIIGICSNNEKSEKPKYKLIEQDIHAYIGFLSAYTPLADFAIAESNILLEKAKYDYSKIIAYDILSVSFKRKEWKYLAKRMSEESGKISIKDSFPDQNSKIVFNIIHTVRLVMDDSLKKAAHYCVELNNCTKLSVKIDTENKDEQYKFKWLSDFYSEIDKIELENWKSFKGIIDELKTKLLK